MKYICFICMKGDHPQCKDGQCECRKFHNQHGYLSIKGEAVMQTMGDPNSELITVNCSNCGGSGENGKDSKGNTIICRSCGGSGKAVKLVHRR